MKYLIAIVLIAVGLWHWGKRPKDPTPLQIASAEVVLYATDWCGYCRLTRQFLEERNIAFVEFDIEKSDEGKRRYDAIGERGVPILQVNGKVITGYDEDGILAALKKS